jgi:hypothetical protein
VSAEKNSTLVLPFPVELLRFLERSTPAEPPPAAPPAAGSEAEELPAAESEADDAALPVRRPDPTSP